MIKMRPIHQKKPWKRTRQDWLLPPGADKVNTSKTTPKLWRETISISYIWWNSKLQNAKLPTTTWPAATIEWAKAKIETLRIGTTKRPCHRDGADFLWTFKLREMEEILLSLLRTYSKQIKRYRTFDKYFQPTAKWRDLMMIENIKA